MGHVLIHQEVFTVNVYLGGSPILVVEKILTNAQQAILAYMVLVIIQMEDMNVHAKTGGQVQTVLMILMNVLMELNA